MSIREDTRIWGTRCRALALAGVIFCLALCGLAPACVLGATFTVNTTDDVNNGVCDTSHCSLREAINAANASAGVADTIKFAIAGTSVHTITPTTGLPVITDAVTINGYSQLGSSANTQAVGDNAVLKIELSGSSAGSAAGLVVAASNCVIQGLIINRFGDAGVFLSAPGNNVQGCYLGTDATGVTARGNANYGVQIFSAANNVIGGATPGARNLISGNAVAGINIEGSSATGNLVQGNAIGTNAAGTAALGNGVNGLQILGGSSNIIGGITAGADNLISGNPGAGVAVSGSTGNAVRGNSIHDNGGLGIDLGGDGVTPNDAGDGDSGANNLQNFPVITSAGVAGGLTTITGTLNSTANTSFVIDFYRSAAADPSGHGEGATYLGSKPVTTDGGGVVTFSKTFSGSFTGQFVMATATNVATNDSSEFSRAVVVAPGSPGQLRFTTDAYTVTESGGSATITVRRVGGTLGAVSVHYASGDGTATAPADYVATSGTLTWANGDSAPKTFTVPIKNDAFDEAHETVRLDLSNPTGGAALRTPNAATLTIKDDDLTPLVSINDVTVTEGDSGTVNAVFHVNLSAPSNRTATVTYVTANGTAAAGVDYVAHPQTTLIFTPGQTSKTVTVLVNGDTADEGNETFKVVLQSASFAAIPDTKGVGTITDNDPFPSLTISDAPALNEGNASKHNALFTVTLTGLTNRTVTVKYTTKDVTATGGSDYSAGSSTLTFVPGGPTSKTVPIQVLGDSTVEPNETFKVLLTDAGFAIISDGQGIHTILNDDASE